MLHDWLSTVSQSKRSSLSGCSTWCVSNGNSTMGPRDRLGGSNIRGLTIVVNRHFLSSSIAINIGASSVVIVSYSIMLPSLAVTTKLRLASTPIAKSIVSN
jgi:hypothetical protein